MSRTERNLHQDFEAYMDLIINHPNYANLPHKTDGNGNITWVITGNSKKGRERNKWWNALKDKMDMLRKSDVARKIHPDELNGLKPCQICGRKMSIFYVYPTVNSLRKINKEFEEEYLHFELDLEEIVEDLKIEFQENEILKKFKSIFKVRKSVTNLEGLLDTILSNPGRKLSPGVMSNAPDRLDGFHTYNACCRSEQDTGRHKSNLSRYTQDRRAYENWAAGDFNHANRLMGEFQKFNEKIECDRCKKEKVVTADHIGPISLGFKHRPEFNAYCAACNSTKNNRMSYKDVQTLIQHESEGKSVISWHSKEIWDCLKQKIKNDSDAKKASKLMRKNLHNVLSLLANIKKEYGDEFLKSLLNPEYAYYDIKFEDFHPKKNDQIKVKKNPLSSKNKEKNAERYVRVSLEALDQYLQKDNRNVKLLSTEKSKSYFEACLKAVKSESFDKAEVLLQKTIKEISMKLCANF